MKNEPENLVKASWARKRAAEAFAAGLRPGDLLSPDEAEDIKEFRAFLAEALARRGLQLNEELDGYRVARAPFTFEAMSTMRLSAVSG